MEGIENVDDKLLFDNTIHTVGKALGLRSRRHELIISNLANADTPGYKSFDLLVDKAMAAQSKSEGPIQMERTHSGHIPSLKGSDINLKPHITKQLSTNNLRGDGNTVDMDREMSNLASNQLLYKVSAQIISKKFQSLKNMIQGGNK